MGIRLGLYVIFLLTFIPFATAQESEEACEDIVAQAEKAFNEKDLTEAADLATQAETACANDVFLLRDVVNLQAKIDVALAQAEVENTLSEANPGLVDIGAVSIFMTCEGEGSPTIIFENGLGWNVDTWNDVYPDIAEQTRVCRYDRLGVGLSDDVPDQAPRTSLEQSVELKAVLETAEIGPPYILVGHSIAGYMLVSFTHLYPDDVAGVVFVDASIPENAQGVLPDGAARGTERLDTLETYVELRDADASDMGEIPIVVLVARYRFDESQTLTWIAESEQWHFNRSTNAQFIIAENSGHYIQNDEPELVIESIEWVLNQIAANS